MSAVSTSRARLEAHAQILQADRIRIGGAACGDPVCINSLLHGSSPEPGLHRALARGLCLYATEHGGDTNDEEAQIRFLRDGGYVKLWNEAEYLLQCIRDYRQSKKSSLEVVRGGLESEQAA